MPAEVEACVESVLSDDPGMDERRAYAICHAEQKGEVTLTGLSMKAVQSVTDRHGAEALLKADGEVTLQGVDGEAARDVLETYNVEPVTRGFEGLESKSASPAAIGFDVPGGPATPIAQKATDSFDPNDPPEEYKEAIEADDFLIYGKASIEQRDVEDQRISVKALENALDRFFGSEDAPGIISRGHADVPVGVPVRSHTLDSDTELVIDGERYQFEAGETIRTEPKDADKDGNPELWLASRLANDSDIARETRYKALTGELNGYSVTVKPHSGATQHTEGGEDILSVDLHAVTLGTDEQIRNKGSEFDVAEFKALLGTGDRAIDLTDLSDEAIDRLARELGQELRQLIP